MSSVSEWLGDLGLELAAGVLFSLIFVSFVARTRAASARARADELVLTYALGWRVASGALTVAAIGMVVLMHGWGRDVPLFAMIIIDTLAIGMMWLGADAVFTRYVVTDEGLLRVVGLRSHRHLRWDRVIAVRYRELWSVLRIETDEGDVANLSVRLSGWTSLATVLLEHVQPRAIDGPTLVVLENARGAFLPDVEL